MEAVIKMTVPAARPHVRWRQIADGVLLAGVLATLYIYARVQGLTYAEMSGGAGNGYEILDAGMSMPVQALPDSAIGVIDISGLGGLIAVRKSMEEAPVSVDEDSQALTFVTSIPDIALQMPEADLTDGGKGEEDDVPITALTVSVYGNGGIPELTTFTVEPENFDAASLVIPRRLGKEFDGWYLDAACTKPFDGLAENQKALELYAGWKEFDGFICNDEGHITDYTDLSVATDGILAFPRSPDCTGIEYGSLEGLEDIVMEVYIYTNITYIAPETFDHLYFLMYIEVAPGNPNYYSKDGILYSSSGELVAYPNGRNL